MSNGNFVTLAVGLERDEMKRKLNGLFAYQAAVYAVGLLLATGIVADWGDWYSSSTAYRNQTDAFFEGRLSLSQDVRDLRFDHTWSEQGIHQVWGLGIPVWRMPWEMLARMCGQEGFPDRIAFGLFALLVSFVVLKVWVGGVSENANGDEVDSPMWRLIVGFVGGFVVLLLLPPFLTLLQTRSAVWEEAVAYEYLFGILLITLLVQFSRRPQVALFLWLCVLAGIGGFIRPTLVFYGFGTVVVAVLWWWLRGLDSIRSLLVPVLIGAFLFCLGGGVLWCTNLKRFGDGFEFGHKLNVQTLYGSMYATRFDDPFQDVPINAAASELFGAIFLDRQFNGANFYKADIFPGQSDVPRWREFYFRTYDLSFLPLILMGWGVAVWSGFKFLRRVRSAENDDTVEGVETRSQSIVLGLWSMFAAVPLLGFYLYAPVISSRYMMDLAPAVGVAVVAAWFWLAERCQGRTSRVIACLFVCGWVGTELFLSRAVYGGPRSLSWEQLEEVRGRRSEKEPVFMPNAVVKLGDRASGVPFDRGGWNQESGALKPTVILFVNNPEFLELDLVRAEHALIKPDPENIRAKIGLELLMRESIRQTGDGWVVRFKGPKQVRWNTGLQSAFVATVPNEFLGERTSPWILKSARWREQ